MSTDFLETRFTEIITKYGLSKEKTKELYKLLKKISAERRSLYSLPGVIDRNIPLIDSITELTTELKEDLKDIVVKTITANNIQK